MKKAIVIGCSGSGKSYFSRKLSEKTGLALYHLDMIWWREDGTNIEREEFDQRLSEIFLKDEWIIDGNYKRTMERRMNECDTVFFLDLPTDVCLSAVHERKGKPRLDIAWKAAPETDDLEFVEFIKNYNTLHRPYVLELLERYSEKNIIVLKSRDEVEKYLNRV